MNVPVAVKVPLEFDLQYVEAFRREARQTANLRHPNIIEIKDADLEAETPYLVMEFLPTSLEDVVKDKPISWRDAAEYGIQVCKALEYAHSRPTGVVHRDIKPDNILLNEDGVIKVCDFGLAIASTESASKNSFGGTPEYMSPEQWLGEEIDGRSDVYSLGITLYQLVTGEVPFQDSNPFLLGKRHESEPLPNFVDEGLAEGRFQGVVLTATQKDPNSRYQTANELRLALLECFGESEGQTPVRHHTFESVISEELRSIDEPGFEVTPPSEQSYIPVGDYSSEERRSDFAPLAFIPKLQFGFVSVKDMIQVNEEWIDSPSGVSGILEMAKQITEEGALEDAIQTLTRGIRRHPSSPLLYAIRGTIYGLMGKENRLAIQDLTNALDILPGYAEALNNRGRAYHLSNDFQSACNDFSEALAISPMTGLFYQNRAASYLELNKIEESHADLSEGIRILPDDYRNYRLRADVYRAQKQFPLALQDLLQVIELASDEQTLARAYDDRGDIYVDLGEYSTAIESFSFSMELDPKNNIYQLGRSKAFREAGEFSDALSDCNEVIEKEPGESRGYWWRGRVYEEMEDYTSAIADFSTLVEMLPTSARGFRGRADCYASMGDYDNAIIDYTSAIEHAPDRDFYYRVRALGYIALEQYQSAILDLTKSIEVDPTDPRGFRMRSRVYRLLKDFPNAMDDANEGMRFDPDNPTSVLFRGHVWREMEDYQQAVTDYTDSINLAAVPMGSTSFVWSSEEIKTKDEADAYRYRGDCYRLMGEYQDALNDYNAAINLNDKDTDYYGRRAYLFSKCLVEPDKALSDCNRIVELEPDQSGSYRTRADIYSENGRYADAIKDYSMTISINPESYLDYIRRGETYASLQDFDEALLDCSEAIRLSSGAINAYESQGDVHRLAGEHQSAVDDYTKVIGIDSEYSSAYKKRGQAYYDLDEFQKSVDDYTDSARLDPLDNSLFRAKADAFIALGEYQDAMSAYSQYIEIYPEDADAIAGKADALWNLGEYELAIKNYSSALALDPSDAHTYFLRGMNYVALENYELAVSDYSVAISRSGLANSMLVDWYMRRGDLYVLLGQYQLATQDYSYILEQSPENAVAYRRRGSCFVQLGSLSQAISDFQEVLRIEPESDSPTGASEQVYEIELPVSIGPYETEVFLSESGLSRVYKAFDARLGRNLATRVPLDWAENDLDLINKYASEAKLLARIRHPNIIEVYDFEYQAGEYRTVEGDDEAYWVAPKFEYTAMEYMPESLADRIRQGRISEDGAVRLAIEVCKALRYLHDNGIVHGDIKPAHMMLGENRELKITNLLSMKRMYSIGEEIGTSRSASLNLDDLTIQKSNEYDTAGDPGYMAPERCKSEPLDGRADIYSVGVSLFEMISGERPFAGESTDVLAQHQSDFIPSLSDRVTVSPEIESVVSKAMGKSRDDRFQTAFELQEALEALL